MFLLALLAPSAQISSWREIAQLEFACITLSKISCVPLSYASEIWRFVFISFLNKIIYNYHLRIRLYTFKNVGYCMPR